MRPTGVTLLDDVLGGIAPGFPLVITGPTGAGRTVLCLQLAQAAHDRGEAIAILTGEPARLLLRQASSMSLDLETALRAGQLELLELDPEIASTTKANGGAALVDAILESAPTSRMLLFDPLDALTSEVVDEVELRALVRSIFDRSAEHDQSIVVTIARDQLAADPALDRILNEACGAILELDLEDDGRHVLQVRKSRVPGVETGRVHFRVGVGGAKRIDDGSRAKSAGTIERASVSPRDALAKARFSLTDDEPDEEVPQPLLPEADAAAETLAPVVRPPPAVAPRSGKTQAPAAEPDTAKSEPAARPAAAPMSLARQNSGVAQAIAPDPEAADEDRRPRLLIVDDCELEVEQMRDWLAADYELFTASDGFAAISAVLAHRPDLILLDLVLPRIDGYEVMRALR